MSQFRYHPDIVAAFPTLASGIVTARNAHNGPAPEALRQVYLDEQKAVIERIGAKPLSELPSLAAWRAGFRKFGVDPTQYRSAAEALLRRLTKKGDIPSINALVDIGNMVSIRYGIPIAVVDVRAIQGHLTVHFADGSEPFVPLDQAEPEYPEVGEVIFSDDVKQVAARRWCWRQSNASAARDDTTDVIITVEAHHDDGPADMRRAIDDLLALVKAHTGAACSAAYLNKENGLLE